MTPAIIVIAAAAVLVVVLAIVAIGRFRRADEGARFRHVADLTSAWSRQQAEISKKADQKKADQKKADQPKIVDLGAAEHSTTDSVDSR